MRPTFSKYLPMVISVFIGIALTITLFNTVHAQEKARVTVEFIGDSERLVTMLEKGIESSLGILPFIRGFYDGSDFVDRSGFHEFVKESTWKYRQIQALAWVPRVVASERETFEKAARNNGLETFQFTERNREGQMVTAGGRDVYYPVFYVEPYRSNESILGFDLGSNSFQLEALNRARNSGKQVATGLIPLVQGMENSSGFLVFEPIYSHDEPTSSVEDRRENLLGFATGAFLIADLVESSLGVGENADGDQINLHIYDETDPSKQETIYPFGVHERDDDRLGVQYKSRLNIGGRKWRISCTPSAHYFEKHQASKPLFILIGGFCFTALLGWYLFNNIWQVNRIERTSVELARFKKILDTTPDMVGIASPEGDTLFLNQGGRKILGYNLDANLTNTSISMFHPEAAMVKILQEGIPTAIRDGFWLGESAILRSDGQQTPVSQIILAHENHIGELQYLSTVCRDISNQRKSEENLQTAYQELKERSEELERFHKITKGREIDMIALKQEINSLYKKLGLSKRYKAPETSEKIDKESEPESN